MPRPAHCPTSLRGSCRSPRPLCPTRPTPHAPRRHRENSLPQRTILPAIITPPASQEQRAVELPAAFLRRFCGPAGGASPQHRQRCRARGGAAQPLGRAGGASADSAAAFGRGWGNWRARARPGPVRAAFRPNVSGCGRIRQFPHL